MSDEQRKQGGLSLQTLLIAAAASAVAALVIPMVWRPGTVFAAAMTPVVVAIVTELLHRPVETVSSVTARRPARGADVLDEPFDEPFDPLAPPSAEELDRLPETTAGRRAVHGRRRPLTGRQWKLALATGLAAFAVVAVVFTATELVAGEAVTGGARTTFIGGSDSRSDSDTPAQQDEQKDKQQKDDERKEEATPEPSATPTATATPEPTASPAATPTVTPTATPVPAEPQPTP